MDMLEKKCDDSIMFEDNHPFEFSEVDEDIVEIFHKFGQIHKMHMTILGLIAKKYNIYQGQLLYLKVIDSCPSISQSELAKKMQLRRATITVSLKKLEKLALIQRIEDPKDQRIICVSLTDKGKEIVDLSSKEMTNQLNKWYGNLKEEEIKNALLLVDHILFNLKKSYSEYKNEGEINGK